MIDISELEVFFININNYLDKPLAKKCLEENLKKLSGAKIKIFTEKDVDIYQFFEKKDDSVEINFYCDYLKYFYLLNTDEKYCLYIDLDTVISDESIQLILENPNNFFIEESGCSNILYLGENEEDKNEVSKIFSLMLNLGIKEYFKKMGDIYLYSFIKDKYKKLSNEYHLNITANAHHWIKKETLKDKIDNLKKEKIK